MGSSFIGGGPTPRKGLPRFLHRYWLPLALSGVFAAVLVLAALFNPGQIKTASQQTDVPRVTVEPLASPCIACTLGKTCDPKTGRCVLIERTPVPCVSGTQYDEEEAYCRPDSTPRRTSPPTRTLRPGSTPRPVSSATPTTGGSSPKPSAPASTPSGPEATP